jgi:type IV pilus assembly protein PilW
MWNKVRCSVRFNTNGLTLIELLIAMVLGGVIMGGIYGVFVSSNRAYHTQDSVADAQQRARVGLYFMVRDMRLAGFDPRDTADAGIEDATSTKIRFTVDRNRNGSIQESLEERFTYEFDSANSRIRRGFDEGTGSESWQPLIKDVNNLTFTYLDIDGNPAANLAQIRTVAISLTVQDIDAQGNTFTRTLNKRVICRNLTY